VSCNIPRQVAGPCKTIVELAEIEMIYWQKVAYYPISMILSYKRDYTITEDPVSIIIHLVMVGKPIKSVIILMQSNSFVFLGNLKILEL
jgi:hypothetical protein